jgi:acyl-coenzyme A synthetase/AMP-(fatty) acid ligase
MTVDHIAYHAIERPDAVAFVDNGRRFTYAQFDRDIRKFILGFRDLGLTKGSRVGLGCSDLYLTWVLLLALERLGASTLMLQPQESPAATPLLASLDAVLSEWSAPAGTVSRRHAITPDWVASVRARADGGDVEAPSEASDDVILILRTTGTTGDPKVLHCTRGTQAAWSDNWSWQLGLTNAARFLLLIAPDVYTIYTLATGVLRSGGTIVREDRVEVGRAIWDHGITHTALFPIHLSALIDGLEEGFRKPPNLFVVSFGATLSESLRERTVRRLATVLCDNYGSREVGFVSRIMGPNSGGVSAVTPDAKIDVVDEHGRSLPWGELGQLRVRAPFMHREYIGDPEATARSFRDGWFNTGDLAIMHGPRRMQLMGRADDLLNIGGTKVLPSVIEELILRIVNPKDVGVCSVRNRQGVEELLIGVSDAPVGDRELEKQASQALSIFQFAIVHLVRLPSIPRNEGGKIQRDRLKQILCAATGLTDGDSTASHAPS